MKKRILLAGIGMAGGLFLLNLCVTQTAVRTKAEQVYTVDEESGKKDDTDGMDELLGEMVLYAMENEVLSAEAAEPNLENSMALSMELPEDWREGTIQIGERLVTFPCRAEEVFEAMKTAFPEEQFVLEYDREKVIVESGLSTDAYIRVADESGSTDGQQFLMLHLENQQLTPCKPQECMAYGLRMERYACEELAKAVAFSRGITMDSSIQEVKEAYGEPSDDFSAEYGYSYFFTTDEEWNQAHQEDYAVIYVSSYDVEDGDYLDSLGFIRYPSSPKIKENY